MSTHATGTRWVRASSMIAVGLAVVAGLGSMMSRDVLGLQFDPSVLVQSDSATFSSSQITANDVGFGMAPVRSGGKWRNILRAGFASATVKGLCVSKTESLAGVKYLVRLQSTGGSFTANDTALDIASLRGVGLNLQGSTQIGLTTTDITTRGQADGTSGAPYLSNPFGVPSTFAGGAYNADGSGPNAYDSSQNGGDDNGQGWTGIDAAKGTLTNVYGNLWQAQVSGNIVLPNLSITVSPLLGHDANGDGVHDDDCAARAKAGNFP